MQVTVAGRAGWARRASPLARRVALLLAVGALCAIAFLRLVGAGSHVDDPRVLRFDRGVPAKVPGSVAQPFHLPRQCPQDGGDSSCASIFELPFDPPGAEGAA